MRKTITSVALGLLLGIATVPGEAAAAGVVDDPRLQTVKAPLAQLLDGLRQQAISGKLVEDKVREGLAKQVPPARILRVATALAQSLREGQKHLPRLFGRKVPAGLLESYALARLGGAQTGGLERVLRGLRDRTGRAWSVRVIDAYADLVARGYSATGVTRVFTSIVRRGRYAVSTQLRGGLSLLQKRYGLSQTIALDTLARAVKLGGSLKVNVGKLGKAAKAGMKSK